MRRGRLVTALAALIVAAVVAGAPLAARAQSKVKIRVAALTLPVFNPIIVNIMREKGFDARHGLDVEVRPFPSISAFYAAFATGEVDTTVVGGPTVFQKMRNEGVPLRIVATAVPLSDLVIITADPAVRSVTDLKGKTLAVVARTAHEAYLAAFFPEVERKLYPNADAARQALKNGEVDAHFGDGMQLSFWLQSELAAGCCAFAAGPYLEPRFFGLGFAVAVPRDATDIKRAINAALESIYMKGVYAELYLRYFPVGFF